MGKLEMIPCVDASTMPAEILEYCAQNDIQTHYQSDVTFVDDDGSVFAEWLKSQGVDLKSSGTFVAILST